MRKLWLVLAFATLCLGAIAQNLSIGASFGVSGYSGELVPGTVDILEMHSSYGIHLRYRIGKVVSIRTGIQKVSISGNDQNYTGISSITERGISFTNTFYEGSAMLELNALRFGVKRTLSSVFIFGGVSTFKDNLHVQRHNQDFEEPTNLLFEKQITTILPNRTNDNQLAFPVGIGLKIFPTSRTCIEFRTGLRLKAGDQLDGVVFEGNTTINRADEKVGFKNKDDRYFFSGVSFSVFLK